MGSDIKLPEDVAGEVPEPANLKFLRRLVTTLTAVMIGGLLILIALVVIRLQPTSQTPAPPFALPAEITLPDGSTPQAFTQGTTWYAVVTTKGDILIYSRATNALIQTVQIAPH